MYEKVQHISILVEREKKIQKIRFCLNKKLKQRSKLNYRFQRPVCVILFLQESYLKLKFLNVSDSFSGRFYMVYS